MISRSAAGIGASSAPSEHFGPAINQLAASIDRFSAAINQAAASGAAVQIVEAPPSIVQTARSIVETLRSILRSDARGEKADPSRRSG